MAIDSYEPSPRKSAKIKIREFCQSRSVLYQRIIHPTHSIFLQSHYTFSSLLPFLCLWRIQSTWNRWNIINPFFQESIWIWSTIVWWIFKSTYFLLRIENLFKIHRPVCLKLNYLNRSNREQGDKGDFLLSYLIS